MQYMLTRADASVRVMPRHACPGLQVKDVPEVLVQVGVCDLLQWLNLIHWDQVAVQVHKLDGNLHAGRRGTENRGTATSG